MDPFRDESHAALLRAAQLEEENARLRGDLARAHNSPMNVEHRRERTTQAVLGAAVSVVVLGIGVAAAAYILSPDVHAFYETQPTPRRRTAEPTDRAGPSRQQPNFRRTDVDDWNPQQVQPPPTLPAPRPAGCDPPYTIDKDGTKRWKRECL